MALSPQLTAELQSIQRKVLDGTHTREELRRAVEILRQDRIAAQTASTTARRKAAADRTPPDTGAILDSLKALKTKLESGPVDGSAERAQ